MFGIFCILSGPFLIFSEDMFGEKNVFELSASLYFCIRYLLFANLNRMGTIVSPFFMFSIEKVGHII